MMIQVSNLNKKFKDFVAVNDVSFEVEQRRDIRSAWSKRQREDYHAEMSWLA